MSSAYHPQRDGQTEVVNPCLQQYLRDFVHRKPQIWGKYLIWVEWHYNTAEHSTTGFSPFQVVYGQPPPTSQRYITGPTNIKAIETSLLTRDDISSTPKQNWEKNSKDDDSECRQTQKGLIFFER